MAEKDYGLANASGDVNKTGFPDVFPTSSKGDGRIRKNNLRTGSAQGAGSTKRKVRCRHCGFPYDISVNDTSGGSYSGNGAGGAVSKTEEDSDVTGGGSFTESYGDQDYRKAGGCPHCFSKNGATDKNFDVPTDPRRNLGGI